MKELKDSLKSKNYKNIYILYGTESYLKKHYEQQIIKALVAPGMETMNLNIFEEKTLDVNKIIQAAETLPFLSEKRVVVIKNSGYFKPGKKAESEQLEQFISNISDTTTLLFVEEEVDKRSKLYKTAAKNGLAAELSTPSEKELLDWVNNIFKKANKKIEPKTVIHFLHSIDNNLENILSESNKLLDYKGTDPQITISDIDDICSKTLEAKIFDLVDCIGNKKADRAIQMYNNLIFLKESPIGILAMISRQFRLILQSKNLHTQGFSSSQIAEKISQRSFVIDSCIKQAANFSEKTLKSALRQCLLTDVSIKTGKIAPETGVLLIITTYSYSLSRN